MEECVWPTAAYVRSLPRLMEWRPTPKFSAKLITAEVQRILAVPPKSDFTQKTLTKSMPASTTTVDAPAAHDCAPQESALSHPVVTEPTPAALELDPPTPDEAPPASLEAPPASFEAPLTPIEAPPTPVETPPAPVDAAPAHVEGPLVLLAPDDILAPPGFAHEPKVTAHEPQVTVPVPSPVTMPSPVFNRDASLHLANFHFEILTGCQFDEQIEARVPAVPSTVAPVIMGFVEDPLCGTAAKSGSVTFAI